MKRLSPEEVLKKDSSSKTIEKWKAFLSESLPLLGYEEDVTDNMWDYSEGIPMADGTTMDVSPTTGRAFFQMSLADKLCAFFATLPVRIAGTTPTINGKLTGPYILQGMYAGLLRDKSMFDKLIPETMEDRDELFEFVNSASVASLSHKGWNLVERAFKDFLHESDVVMYSESLTWLDAVDKENIHDRNAKWIQRVGRSLINPSTSGSMFIYNKRLNDCFDEVPASELKSALLFVKDTMSLSSTSLESAIETFNQYYEVYLQKYMVISLNPIDKFMCSTKQAFSSCMSISKEGQQCGTNSSYAFGLPVLFKSQSVYLTFMTEGKHKNMYWEENQWALPGPSRDPEKAYKYLKMTCRALTYKGTPDAKVKAMLTAPPTAVNNEECAAVMDDLRSNYDITTDRLYVGRQYSAGGEDYIWQPMIEFLMSRQGVATSMGMSKPIDDAKRLLVDMRRDTLNHTDCDLVDYISKGSVWNSSSYCDALFSVNETLRLNSTIWLRLGMLKIKEDKSDLPIAFDKWGQLRSIYYDNLKFKYGSNKTEDGAVYNLVQPDSKGKATSEDRLRTVSDVQIFVGTSRQGSSGIASLNPKAGLDMFKVMTGIQDATYMFKHLRICKHCGKVVSDANAIRIYESDSGIAKDVCSDCAKEQGYRQCEFCMEWYAPDKAHLHEKVDLRKIIDMNKYPGLAEKMDAKKMCMDEFIKKLSLGYVLCLRCGELERYPSYATTNATVTAFIGEDFSFDSTQRQLRLALCSKCLKVAVMCDKCKKLYFLDDGNRDPMVVFPNKKLVCLDCLDKIRIKNSKKAAILESKAGEESVMRADIGLTNVSADGSIVNADTPEEVLALILEDNNGSDLTGEPRLRRMTKDVGRQINSYSSSSETELTFPALALTAVGIEE